MICRTSGIHGATLVCLIRCGIVLAIVDAIAHLTLWYATSVGARELTIHTRRITAAQLIGAILAVVLMITLPRLEDAASVVAAELVRRARVIRTVVEILVRVIPAIVIAIARPHP